MARAPDIETCIVIPIRHEDTDGKPREHRLPGAFCARVLGVTSNDADFLRLHLTTQPNRRDGIVRYVVLRPGASGQVGGYQFAGTVIRSGVAFHVFVQSYMDRTFSDAKP